jgi:hypothetical protein
MCVDMCTTGFDFSSLHPSAFQTTLQFSVVFFTPVASVGYFVIFIVMQPQAFKYFKSRISTGKRYRGSSDMAFGSASSVTRTSAVMRDLASIGPYRSSSNSDFSSSESTIESRFSTPYPRPDVSRNGEGTSDDSTSRPRSTARSIVRVDSTSSVASNQFEGMEDDELVYVIEHCRLTTSSQIQRPSENDSREGEDGDNGDGSGLGPVSTTSISHAPTSSQLNPLTSEGGRPPSKRMMI